MTGILEQQIFRIGQEAVTNTMRHAQATNLHMELNYVGTYLSLRVSDDGRGFDANACISEGAPHFGLEGL